MQINGTLYDLQQFPWIGDLPGLGDDIRHNFVLHINDVRNATVQSDGAWYSSNC